MVEANYIERILVFLINLIGVLLAGWVYFSNKKERLNQWFAIMTFCVIMWVNFAFLANTLKEVSLTTTSFRLNFTFVALFLLSFYRFYVDYFLEERNRFIILEKAVCVTGNVLALLSLCTGLIVNKTVIRSWGTEIIFGPGSTLFYLYAVLVALLVVFFSIKKYIHLSKNQKLKVQYFSVGIFFFILFNIIFNVVLPVITKTVEYTRFGDYSAIILLVFIAYAITKHNLLGVKTLITQVIIVVMSVILASDVFFLSDNFTIQLLKFFVLITFVYFGIALIESIKREQEIMEKIEKANTILAERNRDLHVLLEASGRIGKNLDSKKISQDAVDSIPKNLEYLGYNSGIIVLYNEQKDCLYVYAVTDSNLMKKIGNVAGISIDKFREHLSKSNDLMTRTIKDRKIYTSSNMSDFFGGFVDGEKSGEIQKIIKAKSFISVPLFSARSVIGAIIFSNVREGDKITQRSKDIILAFASHIGSAIENAQLYEKTNIQMKEVSVLNANLQQANVRLEELLEIKNEFLHIASHQLRTPLTAIRGMISMWVEGDFDKMPEEQRKEMLRRIYVSTERLNNITNGMLDALELQGGTIRFQFRKVSVVEMIKDTIATLQAAYEDKGLYLRLVEVDENIPEIDAEPNYLAQVFMNLVDNACKYTKTGGTEIRVKDAGKYVDVYVKDTGIGMDEKEIANAFDKFTRGKNAMKENASGSGLGLFIVKKILDEHKGSITVTSDGPDKGTMFKISLLKKQ